MRKSDIGERMRRHPFDRAVERMAQRMMDKEVEDRHTSFPADVVGTAHTLLSVAVEELSRGRASSGN